jgi:hypothetical protein
MQITITSIDQKTKHSFIITSENRRLRCWNDKVARFGLEQGATYDVETEDSDYNGTTLTYIVKAKRVAQPIAGQPREPFASGAFRPPANSALATPPTPSSKDEQIWVQGILQTFIRAGEVTLDRNQILNVTRMLRSIHREAFGREVLQHQMEAAE